MYVIYKIFLCIHIIVEVGKHIQNIWNFKEILFLERWKFKYELKINHAKPCIKIDNIQNIFGNDPKYCCCVELKQDRRADRLTSPGLEIDISLAPPLPRLLCHYQLRLRAILYTVLSHQFQILHDPPPVLLDVLVPQRHVVHTSGFIRDPLQDPAKSLVIGVPTACWRRCNSCPPQPGCMSGTHSTRPFWTWTRVVTKQHFLQILLKIHLKSRN